MEQLNHVLAIAGTLAAIAIMYFLRNTDFWLPASFTVFLLSHIRYELASMNIRENGK